MRLSESPTPTTFHSRQGTGFSASQHNPERQPTYPFVKSGRRKPRRWPLVLRFIKGAIHSAILVPVICHAIITILIVALDKYVFDGLGLPATIIPSISIVVGLMLVFRNQTSYNRFWDGRNSMNAIHTCIRNITRTIVTNAYYRDRALTADEKADVERVIRILVAIPYAVKNHLRAEWGAAWALESPAPPSSAIANHMRPENSSADVPIFNPEYASLLPLGLQGHEHEGLGLPFQLTFFVESFISRGFERGWFHAPGSSVLQSQLNELTDAYGKMETIKLTPIPVAHLIHQKQVLALFGCVLPFAMVDEMGWWAVPIVTLIIFTLYGIEGIGSQLEDPFGYDRNDIKMDAIVDDEKVEIEVILDEWRRVNDAAEIAAAASAAAAREDQGPKQPETNGQKKPIPKTHEVGEMFLRNPYRLEGAH